MEKFKKKTGYLFRICSVLLTVAVLWSCSSDDDGGGGDDILNEPPNHFTVTPFIGPVPLNPNLQWQNNGDPDDDVLVFDVYLAVSGNQLELLVANVEQNNYVIPESQTLECGTSYQWHVIAKDGNGGETTSSTGEFTTIELEGC